ncbi:neutral amino acid transporter 9 [Physeter macrocephalus]|uniref:Neutral amino acid transporter 9 n=1 Tax=Physeter macrocephalus TaxID=9755 RepID=A0A9W2WUM4_PHYMC|nr:neutral amino acid transporter 9 [Physeter catodon]
MANMDSDSSHLLIPEVDNEINPGPMNIQFDSSDIRTKRPFYIEPTNIVNVNDVIQRVSDHASAMNKRIHYYSRLTAPADKALVAPDHVVPAPEEYYVYSPLGSAYKLQNYTEGYSKNTSLVTIFMIWNTMMGTSILSIPWGIKQAGFTTGMCVIMLMGLLTLYCCYRVVKSRAMISSVDTTTWEYPDVCRYYFGSFGQWSSLLCSLVSLIGAMIVYWVLMSNFLFNTGKFIFNFIHHINDTDAILSTNDSNPVICPSARSGDHPDNGSMIFYTNDSGLQQFEKWWNKSKTVPFYLIGLLLPLLNFKSPSFFSKFNILGTVSILYLIFLVTLKAIRLGFHLEFHWFMPTEFFVPVCSTPSRWSGMTKQIVQLPPCHQVVNPHYILQKWRIKRKLANKHKSAKMKQKVIMVEMKFESNIFDCGNVDIAAIRETLGMQPEELREGEIINMNEESGCDEKDEDVPEEVTLSKNFTLKEFLAILHNIEITKNGMLEADENLEERNMTVHQSIEKKFALTIIPIQHYGNFILSLQVRDLSIAYMLVTLTYFYIGVLVFVSFPSPPLSKDCIEQNFLDNFPSSDILSFIARIFLLFQMMTVYPLLGYLARVQLLGHIFGDIYPSIFHVLILNLVIVGAGVLMACFYPNIGGIIRYSGAACGLAFVFIYPSLIYIISLYQEERLTWPKLIFHIFIIILGLANLIVQFFM